MKQGSSSAISVIVADDHPVFLHGVADTLKSAGDIEVVALCKGGAAAIDAVRDCKPDIAVLDINMSDLDGPQALSRIGAVRRSTKVVFLIATVSHTQISTVIANGAKGLVPKNFSTEKLIECIRTVAAGQDWFPSQVADTALKSQARQKSAKSCSYESLTLRERQVIAMVAGGKSNKEVARQLAISEATVKIHLHKIYKKVGVVNRTALAAFAMTHSDELPSKRARSRK